MIEKVLIGPADQYHLDGMVKCHGRFCSMYDDKDLGFDYQEHLIRKCFEEKGSDVSVYLIYQDFHKSIGFDEDKIYPRDKEHVEGKKTISEIEGSQGSKILMRNKNVKIKKSLHWKPFLEYYCNHEFWELEYNKFLKTLPYYKKVCTEFKYGHIKDYESWNNWLFS